MAFQLLMEFIQYKNYFVCLLFYPRDIRMAFHFTDGVSLSWERVDIENLVHTVYIDGVLLFNSFTKVQIAPLLSLTEPKEN